MSWYILVLKKYAVFNGRAQRKEYWYFSLFHFIILSALMLVMLLTVAVDAPSFLGVLYLLYGLATLLPNIGVSIRRMHDTGRSGWWLFIGNVPLVGSIVLLGFLASDGEAGTNKYGPSPKLDLPPETTPV